MTWPEGRLPGDLRRKREDVERGVERLRDRAPAGVAFIYMVLASQSTASSTADDHDGAALSLPAGLLALMAFGMTVNVYSAIGLMMLFGIVKKNSILQVDYTNTLRRAAGSPHRPHPGEHVRLRPILMTTIAIVAGCCRSPWPGAGSGRARRWRSRSSAGSCCASC